MKAAVLQKVRDIRIEDLPDLEIKNNEVLVKIYSCGICGTDFHVYTGERKVQLPLIQGHEIAGEVVQVGKDVSNKLLNKRVAIEPNFSCGKCFFCKIGRHNLCENKLTLGLTIPGGFSEYVALPQEYIWEISDKISYDDGALIEPLTVGFHAIERANVGLGQKVVIFGLGIIGLSIVQFAKLAGAKICAVDLLEERLELAKKFGADITFNASAKEPSDLAEAIKNWGNGYIDCVFEAVGVPKVQEMAIDIVRPGGKFIVVGQSGIPMKLSSLNATRKEIDILGSIACLFDFPTVIDFLNRGLLITKPLITHKFSLNNVEEAYNKIQNKEAIKVMLHCQDW
jgi:2-desacetyl-2-hydroxyethyl bacteriochlorophyllide A dehydrogenase